MPSMGREKDPLRGAVLQVPFVSEVPLSNDDVRDEVGIFSTLIRVTKVARLVG